MASTILKVQTKLLPPTRWLLIAAATLTKHTGIHLPHKLILWVYCRSWFIKAGNGPWRWLRIDAQGRPV